MRILATLLLLCLVGLFIHSSQAYTEQLIFYDDFNVFDTSLWKHEITLTGGGNWEFQQYVNNRSISFVDNGVLYIKPMTTEAYMGADITKEGFTLDVNGLEVPDICTSNFQYGCSRTSSGGYIVNPITSARLRSAENFSFKYGRIEIKAKLPRGDWIWPAIFMMPASNRYGTWPASGEIDIMESRGNKDYTAITPEGGVESMASTLHWGPFVGQNGYPITRFPYHLKTGRDFADDFHVFGLYWDDKRMYTYIDNENNKVLDLDFSVSFWDRANKAGFKWDVMKLFNPWSTSSNRAPFNQEFFLIICNAVGGTNGYFPDNVPSGANRNYPKPWANNDQYAFTNFWKNKNMWLPSWVGNDTALRIDYVKVWGFNEISTWTINGVSMTAGSLASYSLVALIIGSVALGIGILALCGGAIAVACALYPRMLAAYRNYKEQRDQRSRQRGIPLAEVQRSTATGAVITTHHQTDTDEIST